jgi:hypothetical protein
MDTVTRAGWHPVHPTDLDLLTSGYKPVDWNEVMTSSGKATPYGPKNGLSGKVVDKKENLSQHAKVRVTHIPSYRFYETQTNENGYFHIPFGSDIVDFNFLNIDAWDAPGKMNLTAIIDQEYSVSLRNHLLEEEENSYQQKIRDVISYGDPDLIYSLRYGPRKFSRADKESGKKYNPNSYSHYASVLEIIHEMKPYVIKNGTIVFVSPEQQQPLQGDTREGVIIVINGALKGNRVEILNNLMPSDITNINISTSLLDVHRYTPINFQGVIELTTIQGMFRYRQPAIKMGTDILKTTREFYSPDYSIESPTSADNRKTLCWIPQITLGIGKPALISFYTSDVKGIYHGVVEGMDEYGRPVRTDFSFTVE